MFAGSGIDKIAIVTISWRDLTKTIQNSLPQFPRNIKKIANNITHNVEELNVFKAYYTTYLELSLIIYFCMLDIIKADVFFN